MTTKPRKLFLCATFLGLVVGLAAEDDPRLISDDMRRGGFGLEYGQRLRGTVRNAEAYFPWLTKVGFGVEVEVTQDWYLRLDAAFAASPTQVAGWNAERHTTFWSASQSIGYRWP